MLQGKATFYKVEDPIDSGFATFDYKTNGRGSLCIFENRKSNGEEQNKRQQDVYATNPKYAFHLRRAGTDSAWAILQVVDLSKENLPERFKYFLDTFGIEATHLIKLDAQPLSEIVQSQSFHVDSCRVVQRDGEEAVEVVYTYERESAPGRRAGRLKGTLLLDPKRFWSLRSSEYEATFKSDERFKSGNSKWRVTEFGETSESLPVPKRIESDRDFYDNANHKERLAYRSEFQVEVPRQLPKDDEFILSAFGLPEPPGLEWKRPTPWYLWLALAGIVCLALAVVFRKVTRRRTAVT
jgi:hypothetical protein